MNTNEEELYTTIGEEFNDLQKSKNTFLERVRLCSMLTIPSLIPPEGSGINTVLPTPYQSVGAQGVNNLASKLLLALFPPTIPFFKLSLKKEAKERIDGQQAAEAEAALSDWERVLLKKFESSQNNRSKLFEAFKHLIVSGNYLLKFHKENKDEWKFVGYSISDYVVKRDLTGRLLKAIMRERIDFKGLSPKIQKMIRAKEIANEVQDNGGNNLDTTIENVLFTKIELLNNGSYKETREINGVKIDEKVYNKNLPYLFLRWSTSTTESYGRGLTEEYLGDLQSLEGLSKSLYEGAAIAAQTYYLLRPGSTLKASQLQKAKSGDILVGREEDLTVVSNAKKQSDFATAYQQAIKVEERLSRAFLLLNPRNAERVTAEEIRRTSQELETSLGGVYSLLASELQLPLAKLLIQEYGKDIKSVADLQIFTGVDALGRGNDYSRLATFLNVISGIPDSMSYINLPVLLNKLLASVGVETKGIIKSQEQIQQEQMQAQQAALAQQIAPQVMQQQSQASQQ